jgi:hypothetical protein
MTRIYISDFGDDRNDGLTRETAIYSWQQAVKLCDGNTETNLMQGDATLQRLVKEIAKRRETFDFIRARTHEPPRIPISSKRPT